MGLSRTVSEIDSDFSWKSQKKNSHPFVYCVPAEGVPLGIGYRRWESQKLEWWVYSPTKKFDDIFSRVDTMHQRDRWTDRQTDTGDNKDRAYAWRRAVKTRTTKGKMWFSSINQIKHDCPRKAKTVTIHWFRHNTGIGQTDRQTDRQIW